MIIVISGPLPVKLPIKNQPENFFTAPKDAPGNLRGSPWGQFFETMTTREDMDEIDRFGTKVPEKSASVKVSILHFWLLVSFMKILYSFARKRTNNL